MRKLKNHFLARAAMTLLVALLTTATAWAQDATNVTSETTTMSDGTYMVTSNVTISSRITISGNVTLQLGENTTLTASAGIQLYEGNTLTIEGTGTLNAIGGNENSGIGAVIVGTLIINSGTINAKGGNKGAGIGGSIHNANGGTITINGGVVNATGGSGAAGIGGGYNSWKENYGQCGTITINGGQVTATGGENGPGIGPGKNERSQDDQYQTGSLVLGWTNSSDFIQTSSISDRINSVSFAEGKGFVLEDGNTPATTNNIGGHKAIPAPVSNDLTFATISGLQSSYLPTGSAITLNYTVTAYDGTALNSTDHYTATITKDGSAVDEVKELGTYTLTITAKNGSGYIGSKSVTFKVAYVIEIGDSESTTTQYALPVNMYYKSSLTQQIYTAKEIGVAGTITSISFGYTYTEAFSLDNIQVYMMNVDKEKFDSNTDMVAISNDDKVWEGTFTANGKGWVTIGLDTPFEYDGSSNLLICFYDHTIDNYLGNNYNFRTTATDENTSITYYSDSFVPDLNNLASYSGSKSSNKYHNNIRLEITPSGATIVPMPKTLVANPVTAYEARLTWTGSTDTYNVEYKKTADTDWTPALANTTLTTHTLTGLTPNTDYQARVQSVSGNDVSGWRTLSFKTLISCPAPTNLTVTLTPGNGSVATLTWTENGTATQWEICLNNDEENLSTVTSDQCSMANGQCSIEITGLTTEQAYTAKIRAVNNADDKSEWSDAISFTPTDAYSITLNDGTNTNSYIPVYGNYADYGTRSQFILPATDLTSLQGASLEKLTFYSSSASADWGSSTFKVYMKEVGYNSFDAATFEDWSTMTEVFTGTLAVSGNKMVITFDTPFGYGSDNLLIGFHETEFDDDTSISWYGVRQESNTAFYNYANSSHVWNSSASTSQFLPKVTIGYTPSNGIAFPATLTATNVTAHEATLTWTGGTDTYNVEYKKTADTDWTPALANTSLTSHTLTGLTPNTDYQARVQSVGGNNVSIWRNVSFMTDCDVFPIPYAYGFENASDMNCWTISDVYGRTEIDNGNSIEASAKTGDYYFVFNYYDYQDTDPYMTLITPELTGIANRLHVEFYYRTSGSYEETFRVGYSTTDNNLSSFTWGNFISSKATEYQLFKANYPAGTKYIAVQYLSDNQYCLILDDFSFTETPSCLKPEDLAISNITSHTADLNWTGYSDVYNVNYRTTAYMDGIEEAFSTNPTGWIYRTGALNADGTATLGGTSSWSTGSNCGVFDSHIYMNLYGSKNYWLITPSMTIKNGDVLGFDMAYTAYSGTQATPKTGCLTHRFAVLISTDEMATWTILREWNNSGSDYILDNISKTGEAISPIDLSAYAGATAYIAFFGHSEAYDYDNNLHFDNVVIGTPIAAGEWQAATADEEHCTLTGLVPETEYEVRVQGNCGSTDGLSEWSEVLTFTTDVACSAPIGLAASNMKSQKVDLSWVSGADGWKICVNDDDNNLVTVAIDDVTINEGTVIYTLENLAPATSYTVKVQGDCGSEDGLSEWSNTVTFTTLAACPVPTDVAVTDIEPNSATVNWTGDSESYTVKYRTAAYVDGLGESFDTSSIPSDWTMYTGKLADVMSGSANLTEANYWSFGSSNGVFDSHARVNIYGTYHKWLVTPAVTIPENAGLSFDLALTAYNGNNVPTPATNGTDDKFIVLISTDEMATWTILRQWDNEEGSTYVYNNIANTATGENVSIDLSSYVGQSAYIAFYGESTVNNADNNLHIDNVVIGRPIAAGEWQTVSTAGAETTANLTGLKADTKYDMKVVSSCEDKESDVVTFTTLISIDLADAGTDNSAIIAANKGKTGQVTLSGRTLYKDNSWNTLCLPFSIANINAEGNPLNEAIVRELNDASISGTTLTLNFKDATTAIKAGTPYIVKWEVTSSSTITDPVFSGVTIDKTIHNYDNGVTGDARVRFLGTYDAMTFNDPGFTEDKSILFMGGNNMLYYPQAGVDEQSNPVYPFIGACRAYFKIGDDNIPARKLTAFVLNFGDDETTGIVDIQSSMFNVQSNNAWYSVDGRRLTGKPTKKGIYIHGGKKVVIK